MGMSRKEAGKLGAIKTKLLFEKINLEKKQEYYKKPLICKHCGNPHDYERRKNKFCSISCATTFNNLKKEKKQYKCLNCNTILIGKAKKYCNTSCQMDYNMHQSIKNNNASSTTIKRFLIKEYGNKCWTCNITEWNNKSIVMELEHIDGNSENNDLKNLSLICPNCHSQTPTYKGANKGNGRHYRRIRYAQGKSY